MGAIKNKSSHREITREKLLKSLPFLPTSPAWNAPTKKPKLKEILMIAKSKPSLENLLSNQISLAEKKDVLPRVDAKTILANLTNTKEVAEAQVSLEALKSAVASCDKTQLVEIMATHAALLSALSERLLSDASACKSEKLTVTIIELALKSFDCTRKTLLATNDLISAPTPVVAVQINNA